MNPGPAQKPVRIGFSIAHAIQEQLLAVDTPYARNLARLVGAALRHQAEAQQKIVDFNTNLCDGGCGKTWRDCAYYHVHDTVWHEAGLQRHNFVCLTCLRTRLGRKLTAEDFSPLPVNRPILDAIRNVENPC